MCIWFMCVGVGVGVCVGRFSATQLGARGGDGNGPAKSWARTRAGGQQQQRGNQMTQLSVP
jgi:hypothetical protein